MRTSRIHAWRASDPLWFSKEDKDKVVLYKTRHPEKNARQIALDMTDGGILSISSNSVSTILKERSLTENFFWVISLRY